MVSFNIISMNSFNDSLAVVEGLIGDNVLALSLPVHRVCKHGFRDLVMLDLSDPLPVEFVSRW